MFTNPFKQKDNNNVTLLLNQHNELNKRVVDAQVLEIESRIEDSKMLNEANISAIKKEGMINSVIKVSLLALLAYTVIKATSHSNNA